MTGYAQQSRLCLELYMEVSKKKHTHIHTLFQRPFSTSTRVIQLPLDSQSPLSVIHILSILTVTVQTEPLYPLPHGTSGCTLPTYMFSNCHLKGFWGNQQHQSNKATQ